MKNGMSKLSEEDLNTIKQHNWNLYKLYSMTENGCQSDIIIEDMTECATYYCRLLEDNDNKNLCQHKLSEEIAELKDVICQQTIKIMNLENKNNKITIPKNKTMIPVTKLQRGQIFCFENEYFIKLALNDDCCAVSLEDGVIWGISCFKTDVYEIKDELKIVNHSKYNSVSM